jgi:hypothetical protein
MQVFEMRKNLKEYYKKRGWNTEKVDAMFDNQVIAVYLSYQRQGFPVPKRVPTKKSKNKMEGQLCLFS